MSTSIKAEARSPRRQNGQARVAAIMEAGAALFREKGFDGVTMSDIAARSGTAFGSLYRFFPSKEALADELLLQYAHRALDQAHALAVRAKEMAPRDLAAGLIEFMLGLQTERSFAITVVEARGGDGDNRAKFRKALRDALASCLRAALPALTPSQARASAIVSLHLLKGVAAAADESTTLKRQLLKHYHEILAGYLASLSAPDGAEAPTSDPLSDGAE